MSSKNKAKFKQQLSVPAPEPSADFLRLPAVVSGIAALAWMVWVLKSYFAARGFGNGFAYLAQVPWSWFFTTKPALVLSCLRSIALAAGIIFSAYHAGDFILRRVFKIERDKPMERFCLAAGLGFAVFSLIVTGMGFFSLFYPSIFWALFIGALLFSCIRQWRLFKNSEPPPPVKKSPWTFMEKMPAAILGGFFFMNAIMAFVPEIFYDSLVYHLAMPSHYLMHHGIKEMPFLTFNTYPQSMHMIWTWALALDPEGWRLAKLLHFSLGVMTALGLAAAGSALFSRLTGLLAALFYYSIPYVAMNSWSTGIDAANNFYLFLASACLLAWMRSGRSADWILCAIFCGFMMASKYTTVFGVTALILVWTALQLRQGLPAVKPAFFRLAAFGAIIAALWSPWWGKNLYLIGNPIHPFFAKQLGDSHLSLRRYEHEKSILTGGAFSILQWNWKSFLTAPWWLSMTGEDSLKALGPVFLLLLPLLLLIRGWPMEVKALFWIFVLSYFFWYMGHPLVRYLTTFPALSLVLAYAAVRFGGAFGPWGRWTVTAFCAMTVLGLWSGLFSIVHAGYQPWEVLSGRRSIPDYLANERPGLPNPSYQAYRYIHEHLPREGTRILMVGENKAYYLERDFIHSTVEANEEPLMYWIGVSGSSQELYETLRREGVTHILINYRETIRNHPHGQFNDWDARGQALFDDFWKRYTRQFYFAKGAYIYELLSPEEAARAHEAPPNLLGRLQAQGWNLNVFLNALLDHQRWDEAIEEAEHLAAYGAPLQGLLGSLYRRRGAPGDRERALIWLERAVSRNPQDVQSQAQLILLYAESGQTALSGQALGRAQAANPGNPALESLKRQIFR